MRFTTLLLERWDAAAAAGVLRSSPSDAHVRQLDGPLRLLLHFNASHVQRKRPADVQLLQSAPPLAAIAPPAPNASFNFTKIRSSEVLCALRISESAEATAPHMEAHAVNNSDELPQHAVLANVSPLMRGHALVVFDIAQVKPQRLERTYLAYGVCLVQMAGDPHFALGFNSAGAWSSVNHFHLQGLFLNEPGALPLPILTQRRRELFQYSGEGGADTTVAVFELPDWPMHCYAIGARDARSTNTAVVNSIVHVTWTLVELLQTRSVPHNVLLAHDVEISQPLVIVFPRQLQQENGIALFPKHGGLRFAVAELSGFVVAGSAGVFERFTQDAFVQIMSDEISLAQDKAQRLVTDWQRVLLLV